MPSSPAEPDPAGWPDRPVLQLFYRALSGRSPVLATDDDIARRRQLDGADTLRLPDGKPAVWYRLALAHRAVHEDAGSAGFRLGRPGGLFPQARSALAAAARRGSESDLHAAMRSAAEPRVAVACFLILEELRVDQMLTRQYPGLAPALAELQHAELARRPLLPSLAGRERLLELLVRASLGWRGGPGSGGAVGAFGRELVSIARRLSLPEATVEDSVDAALLAAEIICRAVPAGGPDALAAAGVEYREALDVRLIEAGWDAEARPAAQAKPGTPDHVRQAKPSRPRRAASAGPAPADAGLPEPADLDPDAGDDDAEEVAADLERDGLDAYLYPEWDYRAGAYRQRWCQVRESVAASGLSAEAYRQTLSERHELVAEIRRQFERIVPETLRRVRGVRDGDDLDLDACMDAFADLRAGIPPSDNLYVRRDRTQRDVAVVFLVDLSYSTRQYVSRHGRSYKPIFEVEREALILLMEPLARMGDVFGMYGFSGDGRHDVRIVVIKDVREPLSARVISRLDSLEPIHSTRMGAAIRHATTKLRGLQVGTRLLMVISDGRPSDVDYGQEYGAGAEVEYAMHDTRAALDETRAQGVRPFLLTVDATGSDYLRQMCDELDYEVLNDVTQLPERLAALYGSLSTSGRAPARARPADAGAAGAGAEPRPQLWLSRPAVG